MKRTFDDVLLLHREREQGIHLRDDLRDVLRDGLPGLCAALLVLANGRCCGLPHKREYFGELEGRSGALGIADVRHDLLRQLWYNLLVEMTKGKEDQFTPIAKLVSSGTRFVMAARRGRRVALSACESWTRSSRRFVSFLRGSQPALI